MNQNSNKLHQQLLQVYFCAGRCAVLNLMTWHRLLALLCEIHANSSVICFAGSRGERSGSGLLLPSAQLRLSVPNPSLTPAGDYGNLHGHLHPIVSHQGGGYFRNHRVSGHPTSSKCKRGKTFIECLAHYNTCGCRSWRSHLRCRRYPAWSDIFHRRR